MNNRLRYASKHRQDVMAGLNESGAFFADSLGFVYFRSPPGNWPTYFGNTVNQVTEASSDKPIHLARLCEDHIERRGEGIPIVDELYPALELLMRHLIKEAKNGRSP